MQTNEFYKSQAKLFKALSNESRLKIIDALYEKDHSVGELTELVGLDQSTVSKHLSVLLATKIVDYRKEKNVVMYHLLCPCIMSIYTCTLKITGQSL